MKFEKEITIEVTCDKNTLDEILSKNNFEIVDDYYVLDTYMLNGKFDKNDDYLDTLKKCILLRTIKETNNIINYIVYKYKEYNDKKEIIKESKIKCEIKNTDDAHLLFENIGYNDLIKIKDHVIVYVNKEDELCVEMVNDKHIYIELEQKCNNINKTYNNIDEMKNVFSKYNIPIKDNNYFAKKALVEMQETL